MREGIQAPLLGAFLGPVAESTGNEIESEFETTGSERLIVAVAVLVS